MKIYLDTSVYGGCYDEGFEASNQLIEWIHQNSKVVVYYSDVLNKEINNAPVLVRKRLLKILRRIENKRYVYLNDKSKRLASEYIMRFALPSDSIIDAKHIALASIHKIDYILSWNMKHMVNREALFNVINKGLKLSPIRIKKPDNFLKEYGK